MSNMERVEDIMFIVLVIKFSYRAYVTEQPIDYMTILSNTIKPAVLRKYD